MISNQLYGKIVESMPIPSVEAMIIKNNSLLLLKRKNSPAEGLWWFPGGRIRRGETLEAALSREVKQETNLDVIDNRLVNVYSRVFPQRHDITIVYLCRCTGEKIKLNDEHSEYKYFTEVPTDLHPFLIQAVMDSDWEGRSSSDMQHTQARV